MNIAIVDDEDIYIKDLERLLNQIEDVVGESGLVDSFASGKDLLQAFTDMVYDIVLLDIEMEFDGIATAKAIRKLFNDHLVKIVFVSGHDNYHKHLYEFKPTGFVSKPIHKEELADAIKMCMRQFRDDRYENSVFEFKVQTATKRILQKDILYFESRKRKMRVVFGQSEDTFYSTVNMTLENLREDAFIQVHESFIINLDKVEEFLPNGFIMRNGDKIHVSKSYSQEVKKRIKQYLGWRNQ